MAKKLLTEISKKGLSSKEVETRLLQYGQNVLAEEKKKSKILVFLSNFKNPLIYILLVAAFVTLLMREYMDSIVIFTITLINATIAYYQQAKAENALEALKKMTILSCTVIRDSKRKKIHSNLLVPGDIVVLEEGDKIPADCEILESNQLLVNEAVLTGESLPVKKGCEVDVKEAGDEPRNLVFMGTTVLGGNAIVVVTNTGQNTEFGKISKLVKDEIESFTPLQKKMADFSKKLGMAVIAVCILMFIVGLLAGNHLLEMLELTISMAVSAIPEGLPIAITVILVLGIKRMAKRKAILRNLTAVETLGTTTVIASDKTGTLTHNKLSVTEAYTDDTYTISGDGYGLKGDFLYRGIVVDPREHLKLLLNAGVIVNNGEIAYKNHRVDIFGDPTDCAILVAAQKAGIKKEEVNKIVSRVDEIAFSSERKYQAVLVEGGGAKITYIKGAYEEVISKCSLKHIEGKAPIKMTINEAQKLHDIVNQMASRGLRVLAVAYREEGVKKSTLKETDIDKNFIFVGLIGMKDTYRLGVKDAIDKCKRAGIRIIMITGDHLDTAKAIGQDLSIVRDESEAIESKELEHMSLSEVQKVVKKVNVFARISPAAKYKIIEALKKNGEIVAMTGDGVNDVPALKKADIGIAMGVMGTEAAKDASDMILTDDNFATIVLAVSEGRTVFENIRKTLFYLLSTNLGEVMTVFGGLLLGWPIVLLPLHIIWINLVTDSCTAIPLGMEPAHSNHINKPPRKMKEPIVSGRMISKIVMVALTMSIGALLIFNHSLPQGIDHARTMVFAYLVTIQWLNVINARSEAISVFKLNPFSNRPLLIGLLIAITIQMIVFYTPALEKVLSLTYIGLKDWALIVPAALSIVVIVEIEKFIHRAINRKKGLKF